MTDMICRKSMVRCQIPGMCSPHGGCHPEKTEWQVGYDEGRRMGTKTALAERDQLKAENEALRKESGRYRWLRDKCHLFDHYRRLPSGSFDRAVESAMSKEQKR